MSEDQLLREQLRRAAADHHLELLTGAQARSRAVRRRHRRRLVQGAVGAALTASVATLGWTGGALNPLLPKQNSVPAAGNRTATSPPAQTTPTTKSTPVKSPAFGGFELSQDPQLAGITPVEAKDPTWAAPKGGFAFREGAVYLPDEKNPGRSMDYLPRICGKPLDVSGTNWSGIESQRAGIGSTTIAYFPFRDIPGAKAGLNSLIATLEKCGQTKSSAQKLQVGTPFGRESLRVFLNSSPQTDSGLTQDGKREAPINQSTEYTLVLVDRWLLAWGSNYSQIEPNSGVIYRDVIKSINQNISNLVARDQASIKGYSDSPMPLNTGPTR